MAVVFISPKQRQKVFFMGITIAFVLLLLIISLGVFLTGPKEVSPTLVFNKPKVSINMDVFKQDQFKALQPFALMEKQYIHIATDKNKKQITSSISAVSEDEARTTLTGMGLIVTDIKEVVIGRDNPFTPYYSRPVVVPVPPAAKTTPAQNANTKVVITLPKK